MRNKDAREYEDDLALVEQLIGSPITGKARYEVMDALDENREGVLRVAKDVGRNTKVNNPAAVFIVASRQGEHRLKVKRMSDEQGTGHARELIPAAEALRRLYDAKVEQLRRLGLPESERIPLAVDYACGEVWRCHIQPMPEGGIVKLEDDLYRAIGFDRLTGLRFTPQ
jgi:nucleotide-binding universal stress UspA family protein